MSIAGVLFFFAVICAMWAAVSAALIAATLERHGVKTPFPFIAALIFRNLSRYREITKRETGKIGPLFYSYVVPINTALVLALAAWAVRATRG
jgi:hypothetical protein